MVFFFWHQYRFLKTRFFNIDKLTILLTISYVSPKANSIDMKLKFQSILVIDMLIKYDCCKDTHWKSCCQPNTDSRWKIFECRIPPSSPLKDEWAPWPLGVTQAFMLDKYRQNPSSFVCSWVLSVTEHQRVTSLAQKANDTRMLLFIDRDIDDIISEFHMSTPSQILQKLKGKFISKLKN